MHAPTRKNDIYVKPSRAFAPLLKRIDKLFTYGEKSVTIHGLGTAVSKAVALADKVLTQRQKDLTLGVKEDIVTVYDDVIPTGADEAARPKIEVRRIPAVHITLTKVSPKQQLASISKAFPKQSATAKVGVEVAAPSEEQSNSARVKASAQLSVSTAAIRDKPVNTPFSTQTNTSRVNQKSAKAPQRRSGTPMQIDACLGLESSSAKSRPSTHNPFAALEVPKARKPVFQPAEQPPKVSTPQKPVIGGEIKPLSKGQKKRLRKQRAKRKFEEEQKKKRKEAAGGSQKRPRPS